MASFQLQCSDEYRYPGAEPEYVTNVIPLASGLAVTTSDQRLALFDPQRLSQGPLKRIQADHGGLTSAESYSADESIVATAGENGTVSVWDLRLDPSKAQVLRIQGDYPSIHSLACASSTNTLAAGTEFANHQASILIWDLRTPSAPRSQYTEVHSDDISALTFHPTNPHILLSGSTDGLLNVSDTRIADEDELVIQTFNHGSVHRAAFLNDTELFALSHDEKFALYDVADDAPRGCATLDLGDIRPVLGCQYAANVVAKVDGAGAVLGVGERDQETFKMYHLVRGPQGWDVDRAAVELPGAHGQETVRNFTFFGQEQVVFTGGEDGCVKAWRPGS
ncbi:WD repeat-containing protein 89 [Echria macrotheca]|uniref:WD repeat-containing protein 89 n=1 Tax=Echria macrotheca TaxID=438768 RepID=A0AAJ0BFP4_9PEZI|nr:WD repeat-containing protein 89 [Echria macrotheca]